ncbi:MAG: CotH kinase family protein [Bacteroidia bacterium]
MKVLLCSLLCFFSALAGFSQLPEFGPAFLQDEVASVYITIDEDTLNALLSPENWGNDREFPAQFNYSSNNLNDSVSSIGFRLRGNTSLGAAKKSFKISFNTYEEGQKWQGLEKMNLNGSHNDPSMIRAALCWNAIRRAGLPGSRVSFVRLYINDEYKGLYSNIEHIDEEFADKYFPGSQYNTLFKCLYPAPLDFISNNPDDYNFIQFDRRPYDQKTNDYTSDYRELAHFIDVLNNTPEADFKCEIERIFNVNNFLKYSAIDALTGNWDGYGFNKNNFYLQVNYRTGQIEFIPYDLDNTLGIDWIGIDWSLRDVLSWWNENEGRPLIEKLIEVPEFEARYKHYISEYAQGILHADTLREIAENMMGLIYDAAAEDEYRTQDYGFTIEDFENSLDSAWGQQVAFGIIQYQSLRNESALMQIGQTFEQEMMIEGGFFDPIAGIAQAHVSVSNNEYLEIRISENADLSGNFIQIEMLDNGVFPDEVAGDLIYSALTPAADEIESNLLHYRFIASTKGTVHQWPCGSRKVYRDTANINFINEIMSKNTSQISDPEGNFSDWIELYNPYFVPWETDGYFLTDSPDRPNKWPLPALSISGGNLQLIWANSMEELARTYCNFNISAGGEWIGLYEKDDDHYRLIQYLNVPELNDNESFGQTTDGSGTWVVFPNSAASPGSPNGSASITQTSEKQFTIYPNPTSEMLHFSEFCSTIQVFDSRGRLVVHSKNTNQVNLSHLESGMYFVKAENQTKRFIITK